VCWRNKVRKILYLAEELLYPRRCPVCDTVQLPGRLICNECVEKLHPVREPLCKKCGKPLWKDTMEYCEDCIDGKHCFVAGRGVFVYEGVLKKSIYRFKYAKRQEYAKFYSLAAMEHAGGFLKELKADSIVPVPLYKKKLYQRGYNQAQVFAKELSEILKVPVYPDVVVRTRNTVPQKELDARERQNNLKKAFKIRRNDVKLGVTIIVDDIYTTGSTIEAVAQLLLKAGAERIYFVTIGIGK